MVFRGGSLLGVAGADPVGDPRVVASAAASAGGAGPADLEGQRRDVCALFAHPSLTKHTLRVDGSCWLTVTRPGVSKSIIWRELGWMPPSGRVRLGHWGAASIEKRYVSKKEGKKLRFRFVSWML